MIRSTAATVTVLGSINMDVVLRVPRFPAPGETILSGAVTRHPDGKGANQAIAAARAGAVVRMIGAVGDDADGREMLRLFEADGIDCARVVTTDQATGTAYVSAIELAIGLADRPGQTIIVTRGKEGSIAVGPEGVIVTPAKPVRVVDTTGAGDCLCGFLAAGIATGRPLQVAIGQANEAAAIAVGRLGAASSIPFLAELD